MLLRAVIPLVLVILFSDFGAAQPLEANTQSTSDTLLPTVGAVLAQRTADSARFGGNWPLAIGATAAYYGVAMYVLQHTWYKDRPVVPFHFYNDGGGYMQVDKCGHAFGAYVYSSIGLRTLEYSGMSRGEALFFGGALGLLLQTPVEIMDGIHEGYGFSWYDMLANALGSSLVFGQELLFDRQLLRFKFSYTESTYAEQANGFLGTSAVDRLLKDYNGHSYWLSLPLEPVLRTGVLPAWLALSVGYGAGGMFGEYENITAYQGVDLPAAQRYRRVLLSLDVDWSALYTDSALLNTLLDALNFLKVPLPTLELRSTGEVRWHALYF